MLTLSKITPDDQVTELKRFNEITRNNIGKWRIELLDSFAKYRLRKKGQYNIKDEDTGIIYRWTLT